MAYITITAPDGYLVNGLAVDEEFRYGRSLTVRFSTPEGMYKPTGFVIYRQDGTKLAEIEADGSYTIEEMGSYYAVAFFD